MENYIWWFINELALNNWVPIKYSFTSAIEWC
jgi:hypothetical protein